MKNTFRNIIASLLSLAIFAPLAIKAEHHYAGADNLIENSREFFQSAKSDALRLDSVDEALLADSAEPGNEVADNIIEYANNFLGVPYRYGAKGPKAFDCSGFTSYIFGQHGIELASTSRLQSKQGEELSVDEIQPGDLLFFGGRAGGKTVGHVAMAVEIDEEGKIKFIHASTSKGISYNTYPDDKYYSKRFLGARRVIQ